MPVLAILHEAAVCELDGPLITGPMTSMKILGNAFVSLIIINLKYKEYVIILNWADPKKV